MVWRCGIIKADYNLHVTQNPEYVLFIFARKILEMASYIFPPNVPFPPRDVISEGDSLPESELVMLDGISVKLPDLHTHKDRPLMILASSASWPPLMVRTFSLARRTPIQSDSIWSVRLGLWSAPPPPPWNA